MKVTMFGKISTKTGRFTVTIHLADQSAFDELFEAVVNRSQGDIGCSFLDPSKNLFGCRVVAFRHENLVDELSLTGHPQPAFREGLIEKVSDFVLFHQSGEKVRPLFNEIKNYSNLWSRRQGFQIGRASCRERVEDSVVAVSSRRRHTRWPRDWSSDVCSSDLVSP